MRNKTLPSRKFHFGIIHREICGGKGKYDRARKSGAVLIFFSPPQTVQSCKSDAVQPQNPNFHSSNVHIHAGNSYISHIYTFNLKIHKFLFFFHLALNQSLLEANPPLYPQQMKAWTVAVYRKGLRISNAALFPHGTVRDPCHYTLACLCTQRRPCTHTCAHSDMHITRLWSDQYWHKLSVSHLRCTDTRSAGGRRPTCWGGVDLLTRSR